MNREEIIAEANKPADKDSPQRVTVLYGDIGKRKTTTACSMVNERGLLLNTDKSWEVLLNNRHKELYDKVKVIKLQGIKQLDHINLDGYDTIIWDTVSGSVDRFLDLLYDESDWGGKYRELIKTQNPEIKGLEVLAPVDYRVTRDYLRPAFSRLFRKTDAHLIFTSQMREPLPGLSANSLRRPSMPEATFKFIAEQADLIANIRPEGSSKFVIDLTEGSLSYLAKSRIEGLQGKMELGAFVNKYKEIVF